MCFLRKTPTHTGSFKALSVLWTVTLTCVKLWSDLLCRMSQQYYCSAATQAKHDNLVSQADLTAKVPLRTLKHVNSQAISILARQKMPFSMLYWLNSLSDVKKTFCSFKCVSVLLLWPTVCTFMPLYIVCRWKHCFALFFSSWKLLSNGWKQTKLYTQVQSSAKHPQLALCADSQSAEDWMIVSFETGVMHKGNTQNMQGMGHLDQNWEPLRTWCAVWITGMNESSSFLLKMPVPYSLLCTSNNSSLKLKIN